MKIGGQKPSFEPWQAANANVHYLIENSPAQNSWDGVKNTSTSISEHRPPLSMLIRGSYEMEMRFYNPA